MSGSLGDVRIDSQQDHERVEDDGTADNSPHRAGTDQAESAPGGSADEVDTGTVTVDGSEDPATGEESVADSTGEASEQSPATDVAPRPYAWNDGLIARRAERAKNTTDESTSADEAQNKATDAGDDVQQPVPMDMPLVDVAVVDALPSLGSLRPASTEAVEVDVATGEAATELPTAAGTGTGSFATNRPEPLITASVVEPDPRPEVLTPAHTTAATEVEAPPEPEAPRETEALAPSVAPKPESRPLTHAPSGERGLGRRLIALRELVGLSRTRLAEDTLAEAVRVLDEAAARGRLSRAHTTVAIAGSTGCGKSTLFNALAGAQLSEAGVRRPTTAAPVACVWETTERAGGADGLLERLGVPPRSRRRAHLRDSGHRGLGGLVLLDLPDHDSMATGHRQQVDRILQLVDAVIWVVDPEKYADALLHERYLRPLAGHAEVTYVVLNQTDRLSSAVTSELLDDLRRLLDDDGMALGEHGDPGAQVLSLSALTGDGVSELRDSLRELVADRSAAARRLAADVGRVVDGLRPVCVGEANARPEGLTAPARESFEERLAVAVGAAAVGSTAERAWLRQADLACGTAWAGIARMQVKRAAAKRGERPGGWAVPDQPLAAVHMKGSAEAAPDERTGVAASSDGAATGLGETETRNAGRAVVEQAVRGLADDATKGLPKEWARSAKAAAMRGGAGLPAALDRAVATAKLPVRPTRPTWWTVAAAGQVLLLALQFIGVCWLVGGLLAGGMGPERWLPFGLLVGGALGAPLLAWACRVAARGPARAFGLEQELRLRRLAADSGRARVLEPVAAELLRYTEVREQYVIAAAGPHEG